LSPDTLSALADNHTDWDDNPKKAPASHWHATDIIWIVIFPLSHLLA